MVAELLDVGWAVGGDTDDVPQAPPLRVLFMFSGIDGTVFLWHSRLVKFVAARVAPREYQEVLVLVVKKALPVVAGLGESIGDVPDRHIP